MYKQDNDSTARIMKRTIASPTSQIPMSQRPSSLVPLPIVKFINDNDSDLEPNIQVGESNRNKTYHQKLIDKNKGVIRELEAQSFRAKIDSTQLRRSGGGGIHNINRQTYQG